MIKTNKKKYFGNTGRIFEYMKTHDGITSMEAFKLFGVTRLSAIIFYLRKKGHDITNEKRRSENKYGEPVMFVRYHLM